MSSIMRAADIVDLIIFNTGCS